MDVRQRQTNLRPQEVVEVPAEAVIVLDDNCRVASLDARAERMLGLSTAKARGRDLADLLLPPSLRDAQRELLCRLEPPRDQSPGGLTVRRLECSAMRADGLSFPVEVSLVSFGPSEERRATCLLRDLSPRQEAESRLARSEALLAEAELVAGFGSFELDLHTGLFEASPGLARVVGAGESLEHAHLTSFLDSFPPPARRSLTLALGEARRAGESFELQLTVEPSDAEERTLRARGRVVLSASGEPVRVVGTLQDITDEVEVRSTREFLSYVVDSSTDAIYTKDLRGRITSWNRGAERLYGYSAAEAIGQPSDLLLPPAARAAHKQMLASVFAGSAVESMDSRRVRKDGTVVDVSVSVSPVRDRTGRIVSAAVIAYDITERKRLQERLQHLADHDPLTDLLNRRRFEQLVELELERSSRYGVTGAIISIDLDGLKAVNDSAGHAAGDSLIRHAARVLSAGSRASDVVARLGGDEFVILLPAGSGIDAGAAAAHLLAELRNHPLQLEDRLVHMTASMGVVPFGPQTAGVQELLSAADQAMYEAKRAGRNQVVVLSASQASRERESLGRSWAERIRQALDTGGFTVLRQPILDLRSGETSLAELLVRMPGERRALIAPAAFLPSAARYGMLPEIDRWMLRQALELVSGAALGDGVPVAVNISGESLADPDELLAIIEEFQAPAADAAHRRRRAGTRGRVPRVTLEVRQADALSHLAELSRMTLRLRALGCGLALDDFGGGVTALRHLRQLPLQYLKLPCDLAENLVAGSLEESILIGAVEVARALGARVIATGVPSRTTVGLLLARGVELGQGYGLAHPTEVGQPATARGATSPLL